VLSTFMTQWGNGSARTFVVSTVVLDTAAASCATERAATAAREHVIAAPHRREFGILARKFIDQIHLIPATFSRVTVAVS
jgi:hypothetical protein